jgi:hypothetical protein
MRPRLRGPSPFFFLYFGQTVAHAPDASRRGTGEGGGSKRKEAPNEGSFREMLGCLAREGRRPIAYSETESAAGVDNSSKDRHPHGPRPNEDGGEA